MARSDPLRSPRPAGSGGSVSATGVLIVLAGPLGSQQPAEVQQPEVAGGQVGACLYHRPEPVVRLNPVVVGVAVQVEADDHVVAGLDHRGGIRVAVLPRDFGVEESTREAEH